MSKKMKQVAIVLGIVVMVLFILFGFWGIWRFGADHLGENSPSFGASHIPASQAPDLVGSSSNLVSLPRTLAFANSTTTQSDNSFAASVQTGFLDGGGLLTQSIPVGGQDSVLLSLSLKGGTATSTFQVRQQFSYDESNWFDVYASSTAKEVVAYNTSTVVALTPTGVSFDPGTVTTTPMAFRFSTYGAKFSRFLYLADDLITDPADGVQAWIEYISIEPIVR